MRICHITPHLPPDQAANALLPYHLGCWAREAGDQPVYVAHPSRDDGDGGRPRPSLPGPATWVPRHRPARSLASRLKIESLVAATSVFRAIVPVVRECDLVHVHSNGLLAEVGGLAARWLDKPYVLTLYGTEIWHYKRGFPIADRFTSLYQRAAAVTFYSRGLLDRASDLGLEHPHMRVVYPPVAATFAPVEPEGRHAIRARLGLGEEHILLNVKRLHPLAGQRHLLNAMPEVLGAVPDTRLIICGTGPLQIELEEETRALGVSGRVTFAGLLDNDTIAGFNQAADLFVLPSLLEACPTVALEALASGTTVVSSDNPGGVELHEIFGDDVAVVPRADSSRMAAAIIARLQSPRRTTLATNRTIEDRFRAARAAAEFREVYRDALSGAS
jgi:glycosyltransferase involved in cell wall biosynthesis